jgi:hypothetical protein
MPLVLNVQIFSFVILDLILKYVYTKGKSNIMFVILKFSNGF